MGRHLNDIPLAGLGPSDTDGDGSAVIMAARGYLSDSGVADDRRELAIPLGDLGVLLHSLIYSVTDRTALQSRET